ncbi:TPA-induced transmembrane protein isoform X2 [Rhineura floridana]|uniref:TPA-induced transmembrane protein isoform X2 n=1 Tax=Rhineura floridana TaxID=261503 RepID=UPI002AC7F51C|nr:TPA-induced transmembrane protein isoform X2 [Rhineura floridana]
MNGHVSEQEHQAIELHAVTEQREEEPEPDLNDPLHPEAPRPDKTAILNSCSKIVFWKCKLWMIITSVFLALILVSILSLVFYSADYIDEDEFWDPESIASGNRHNFSGILKIHCTNPGQQWSESGFKLLSENLSKRLTDVYSFSSALGRYFLSAEIISFSKENNTVSYFLRFSVPPETEEFMKYRMSEEFLMNVLRQNIYDEEEKSGLDVPECTNMALDPTSLSLIQIQTVDTEG